MKVKKWMRKLALLLCMVMLCSVANVGKAEAKFYNSNVDVKELEVGDYGLFKTIMVIPSDYTVTINGKQYTANIRFDELEDMSNHGIYVVDSYTRNDAAKTIDIVIVGTEGYNSIFMGAKQVAGDGKFFKVGTEVTVTASIPEEYQPYYTGFGRWYAFNTISYTHFNLPYLWHNYDGPIETVDIGLSAEEMSQPSITFAMPSESVIFEYEYYINTVSGNVPRGSWERIDTSYLNFEISASGETNTETTEERASDNNGAATTDSDTPVVSNIIQTSAGVTLTTDVPMHYVAKSVTGVMPTASAETVNRLAGLSDADIQAGAKAKFYIGDVYKAAAKQSLREAATGKGTIISMLDIDLYTLGGKNGILAVRNVAEPIRIVIGIPQGKQAANREYSLICIKDGTVVEVKDTDNDAKTITADLNYFGAYALIYK